MRENRGGDQNGNDRKTMTDKRTTCEWAGVCSHPLTNIPKDYKAKRFG